MNRQHRQQKQIEIKAKWEDYLAWKFPERKKPEPEPEPEFIPEPLPTMAGRFRANVLINSADEIVERHRTAIAKFDREAITDDIRSFGQTEFERGIEFAMKYFEAQQKNAYLANPQK